MIKKKLEDHFGDVIQKARQGLGITPEMFSRDLGLTTAQTAAAEAGQWIPEPNIIEAIAAYLNLNPSNLKQFVKVTALPAPATINTEAVTCYVLYGELGEANCYVVKLKQHNACIIIDPGVKASRILHLIDQIGVNPMGILLTHSHKDHAHSLQAVREYFKTPVFPESITENELLSSIPPLQIWDTPGHTDDSRCYLLPDIIFVGDLLFAGSVGRASESNWQSHLSSARRVLTLPEAATICPGHGPVTTAAVESKINPFM
ncbi:MAG: MBL fold metallo-hydrolase [Candidatus Wallacebacter cryptica]|nr:MBL fold metallo-hydrolase [Bacillota bacterium]